MSVLDITGLAHAYGTTPILHGLDLSIDAGEIVSLLGPSGCGKTTLLRCIAGLEPVRAGTVHIAGHLVATPQRHLPPEQRGVGLVFQDFALFPHRSVADNVAFGLRGMAAADRTRRVRDMLERVGVAHLAGQYPHQLSGGQQQRVALARAVAPRPRLMLMDEPFSGLDTRLRRSLREETRLLLKEAGIASVVVTHDGEEALAVSDRICLMRDGHIVLSGSPETVWQRPADAFCATFFGDCTSLVGQVTGGRVRCGRLELPLATALPDGVATVVIRHGSLRLAVAPPPQAIGVVVDTRFLGVRRITVVDIAEGGRPVLLTARHDDDLRFAVGAQVGCSIAPGGWFCFPGIESADGSVATTPPESH